jgi:uncharacterized membrane protein
MSRLVKILIASLVMSVLLNVFFVGFWGGRAAQRGGTMPWRDRAVAMRDRDHGPGFAEIWRRQAGELEGPRHALEAARRDVHAALIADPFDPAALEAALSKLRSETGEAQLAFHRSLLSMARDMKPEERRALGESRWLAEPERRGNEGHRR